jgi:hypothetical protein
VSWSRLCWAVWGLLLAGCPQASTEPPPPPRKAEILPAPPRARGAHAAGTDAAPRPEITPAEPDSLPAYPVPGAAPDADAGAAPDAAPPPSPADAGTAL